MRRFTLLAVLLSMIGLVQPTASTAAPAAVRTGRDVTELPPDHRMPDLDPTLRSVRAIARQERAAAPTGRARVGDEKAWLAYDDTLGIIYLKYFRLLALGDNAEVWVAVDPTEDPPALEFPTGDCRNDGVRTRVTKTQARYLVREFDRTMYPIESASFSVPPSRDGTDAPLTELVGLPSNYYRGGGDNVVVLVDNIRDDNFYDEDNENTLPYIAGFYADLFDDLTNRLVMNIDGWDWLHRTGANPPHEPSEDPCLNAPSRPFLYEGTFAHEYQHLLERYEDPTEVSWVNEGLSMYAETLTGYANPALPITDPGFNPHTQCFLGHLIKQTDANPIPGEGGPENSLTIWGDQTDFPDEILCDYGAAYTFMEYLHGQFGPAMLSRLHRANADGLDGLQNVVDDFGGVDVMKLIDRWATMVAVDRWLDRGATLIGGAAARFSTPTLRASINWDNDQAYAGPGAPPNGSDYVRLRDGSDAYLGAGDLTELTFDGTEELPTLPVEWVVDEDPPGQPGDAALYSGSGDNLDRAIVRSVDVPAGTPELTFDASWDTEQDFDYAYVQVSTDEGETYTSIACTDSEPGPLGPAFHGDSGGWTTQTCDLSAYAGTTILLAFRYVTDPAVTEPGIWIDDVAVDGTVISDGSTLAGWQSPTEINPIEVEGFTVRLISFDSESETVQIAQVPLDEAFDATLDAAALEDALGTTAGLVAAIVTYHDRSETVMQQAPYTLTVNGVVQPGGGAT